MIPINTHFLEKNIKSWSYLEREELILKSNEFRKKISWRRSLLPEYNFADYTCLQKAKIDLIKYVIDNKIADFDPNYYGWIDFSYIRKIRHLTRDLKFHFDPLKTDQVHFIYHLEPIKRDLENIIVEIVEVSKIQGGFFFGSKNKMLEYEKRFHKAVDHLYNLGLATDDQAIFVIFLFKFFSIVFTFFFFSNIPISPKKIQT